MTQKTYPNRIREIRKLKKVTQAELGFLMQSGLTDSTIAKLESGAMVLTVPYMLEIATVLGVNPIELVFDTSATGVRYVPVLEADSLLGSVDLMDFGSFMGKMQPIPIHHAGVNLFAVRSSGGKLDSFLLGEQGYMIVDPDDCELADGHSFAVISGGLISARKFCVGDLTLATTRFAPDAAPIKVGGEPFKVLGRVVHVGYDM
jgi:transcriptional regulator with XRE-family HTH domain